MFFKIGALKNFAIFRKITLLESPFNKVAGSIPPKIISKPMFPDDSGGIKICNFIKRRLQHRFFPVIIAKFLRALILKNICERLLLPRTLPHECL